MLTKIKNGLLLTATLSGLLMSCSKQNDVQPAAAATTVAPDASAPIKLVNGRLVFSDLKALNQTREALASLGRGKTSAQDLAAWESALRFTSLRTAANAENAHLEALETQGMATPAHELMVKFGFPISYASLISPSGEYQVGDKIYWFHAGSKYQASSEDELAAIKQNPAAAKVKLLAGYKVLPNANGLPKNTEARTIADNDPYCDDKYSSYFNLNNDGGSQRRTIYGINVYTEDDGVDYGGFYHFWQTSLNLFIKFEYYSNGRRKWYPADGQTFLWNTNFSYDATPSIPYQNVPATTQNGSANYQNSFSNGVASITLASQQLVTSTVDPYLNQGQITWNFQIGGSIQGYPSVDYAHNYVVNSGVLW